MSSEITVDQGFSIGFWTGMIIGFVGGMSFSVLLFAILTR